MNTRRDALRKMGITSMSFAAFPWLHPSNRESVIQKISHIRHTSAKEAARDEAFWYHVQRAYTVSPHFINLENGYFSLQAREVMEAQFDHVRMINQQPALYMRTQQWDDKQRIKEQLAAFAGCSPEEIAITRNTTEALDTVIHGLPLEKGDEVITTTQDYGSMIQAFDQQVRRVGIINRKIDLPLHPKNKMEVVKCYENAITDKTKVMLVTHLINLTGQILPVKEISEMAHANGVEVISDSAHAFAHIDFKIPDLGCDYFGTSLHKWLGTPVGLGMLYIKKEKIKKVWPLFGDTHFADDDIRKLEHIGTHPVSSNLTIASALRFHNAIGTKRKEERLRYLKNYWAERVKDFPGVVLNVPLAEEQSCGLGNVGVEGITPADLAKRLYDEYRIFTVAIDLPAVKGIRVTPHLYTTLADLDAFVNAMAEITNA